MVKIYILDILKNFDKDICRRDFPKRYEKSQKFLFEEDRLRSWAVSCLLSKVLGLNESDIETNEYGKPFSKKKNEKFSISHSGKYCILCVGENEIGVDIEKVLPDYKDIKDIKDISRLVFSEDEISYVNGGDSSLYLSDDSSREEAIEESKTEKNSIAEKANAIGKVANEEKTKNYEKLINAFFKVWTMKESVSKMLGIGMSMEYKSFSVMPILNGKSELINGKTIFGKCIAKEEYMISVCMEKKTFSAELIEVN